jgi:hypothetical protein
VEEVRSARILTYRFEDIGIFVGTAVIKDGTVKIKIDEEVREFPRDDLILILEGRPRERNYWFARLGVGLVSRSGNTNQNDFNATIRLRRQSPKSRLKIEYAGNIGRVEGTENVNNHNFLTSLDMLIKAGFFVTPFTINLYNDRFQNIDLRTTLAAGAGYVIVRGGDVDWSLGLAAGYLATKYVSVQEGQEDADESFALIPNTGLEVDFTKDIEFKFDYNSQIGIPDPKNTYHHANGTCSVDIWGDFLDLDLSATWDRTENPKPDAEGNIPKRDDLRISFGFGMEF